MSQSSVRGMDISSYTALKKAGVKYYDFDGKETSLLKVLHDNEVNYIRIRIWNDPTNEKEKHTEVVRMMWQLALKSQKKLHSMI